MIWLRKLLKNEAGQSSVLMAFIFVVLCSVAALAVDIGHMSAAKTSLQNAADSAALSGAYELPSSASAVGAAESYAELNGVDGTELTVNTPYNGDPNKIEVICTKTVDYMFARVLGLRSAEISARSVAERAGMSGGPFAYTVFSGSMSNCLMFNNSSLYIEGSAHANNVLQLNGSYMTVTGTAEAVSNFFCYGSLITIDTARARARPFTAVMSVYSTGSIALRPSSGCPTFPIRCRPRPGRCIRATPCFTAPTSTWILRFTWTAT
jgi:hypothetical protein